jgi:RND superfamily putative drug exporter
MVVNRPWVTIAVWLVAAVAIIALAPKLTSTTDESSFLPSHYESIQAADLQQRAFPSKQNIGAIIVFSKADGGALTTADAQRAGTIARELNAKHIPKIDAVMPGQLSPNHLVLPAMVAMPQLTNPNDTSEPNAVKTLRLDLKPLIAGTDLHAGVTGNMAEALDQESSGNNSDAITLIATLAIILILLLIIFRSPIIAVMPLLTVIIAGIAAFGLIADANKLFDLKTDSSITPLLIVVMLGVGTDYILFLLFRYRERLRLGEDPKTAMVTAVARVGEAISCAAGVVIIAFLALALSSLGILRSLGPALAIAVAVALLAGLTLVPAVVSLLGSRVFWPSKSWRREPDAARFRRVGEAVGRRPAVFALVSGVVLAALAIGAFGYKADFDLSSTSIPKTAESMVALKTLEQGLPPGATDPTNVYLTSTDNQPLAASALATYRAELAKVPGVGSVAPAQPSSTGTTANYQVTLANDPDSNAALATVRGPLRQIAHADAPAGTKALVGGTTSVYVDINAAVDHDYEIVFPIAALLIMLILGLLLRSVVAPWYLIASVGLGFGATLGATVMLFQHVQHQPGLMFILPIVMYMFVVALGTDYNILMISRLREEAKQGHSPRRAAAVALRHAGPTVAAAGVILAGSMGTLGLAQNSFLQEIGFAVSFGIIVAAFVMAMFFTPSLTALIGHAAWWPGHGDRTTNDIAPRHDEPSQRGENATRSA